MQEIPLIKLPLDNDINNSMPFPPSKESLPEFGETPIMKKR